MSYGKITRAEVYDLANRFLTQELAKYPSDRETQRKRKEIEFNRLYADCFAHGTDGHNLRIICAQQEEMIETWAAYPLPPVKGT